MAEEYILYMDDTGFNAQEKHSEVLKQEQVTYAGVLVPVKLKTYLENLMNNLCGLLQERYGTNEFHFTEIYNRKPPFQKIQIEETLDMLAMFSNLFCEFDLKIFVHTSTKNIKPLQQSLVDQIDELAPYLHLQKSSKTQAMLLTYLKAKKYVEKKSNSKIVEIVCDEGLRKNGAEEIIKNVDISLKFKSSKECVLLQLADYSAWFLTRAKNILDKLSKNKKISEIDSSVLGIYSNLNKNYVGLPTQKLKLAESSDFSYDKTVEKLKGK